MIPPNPEFWSLPKRPFELGGLLTGGGALSGASEFLFIPPSPDFWIFSSTLFVGGGGGSFLGGGLTGGSALTPGDLSLLPREGNGGGGWLTLEPPSVDVLLVDSRRAGSDGRDCERLLLEFAVDGRDRDVCSCLLGGRGGSSASPHAGARTPRIEPESIEVAEVPGVLPALVEVEREASEATDSNEVFREISEGLRGGSAGADCVEHFREGKGGGTLGFWPIGGAGGGGRTAGFR